MSAAEMATVENTPGPETDSKPTIEAPTTDSDTSSSSELSFAPAEPEQDELSSSEEEKDEKDEKDEKEGEENEEEKEEETESDEETDTDSESELLGAAVGAQKPEDFINMYYRIPNRDSSLTLCHAAFLFLMVVFYAWVAAYQVEQFKQCCRC